MCNMNVVDRISCFCLIIFLRGDSGVAFATLATPWLRPRIMCYAWISSVGELRGCQDVEKPEQVQH